jgi:hypothetical protein
VLAEPHLDSAVFTGPRGQVRNPAPVSGPEHVERVCDAARERWPRAYARDDEEEDLERDASVS